MILFEEKTSQQLEVNMTIFNRNECYVWFEPVLTNNFLVVQIEVTKSSTFISTNSKLEKIQKNISYT